VWPFAAALATWCCLGSDAATSRALDVSVARHHLRRHTSSIRGRRHWLRLAVRLSRVVLDAGADIVIAVAVAPQRFDQPRAMNGDTAGS
jgi:hypothetical protein